MASKLVRELVLALKDTPAYLGDRAKWRVRTDSSFKDLTVMQLNLALPVTGSTAASLSTLLDDLENLLDVTCERFGLGKPPYSLHVVDC